MDHTNDTLSLGHMVPPHNANHPQAAAEARARIAAFGDTPLQGEDERPHPSLQAASAPSVAHKSAVHAPQATRPHAATSHAAKPARPHTARKLPSNIKPIVTAIASFALILLAFKAPVLVTQLRYSGQATQPTPATQAVAPVVAVSPDPVITIPKINVTAPVVYPASTANAPNYDKELESGVVHYPGTALPGQAGNSVMFGHSSNDWWEPGNYKFVFVLLDKLVVGDRYTVNYNSKQHIYEVTSVSVVDPTDISVLNPTTAPTMTLITCTPPGTSWKRLIVKAKLVSPNQELAQAPDTASKEIPGQLLPGNTRSFTEQVSDAWQALANTVGDMFGKEPEAS